MRLIDVYLTTCLYAALGGAGLLVLAFLYRDYRIDRMRDELFAVRDELFDYAVAEGLLGHPAYRQLRNIFNGMLRFCHKISFFRLSVYLALDILWKWQRKKLHNAWLESLAGLPEQQKAKLLEFHLRMFVIAMRYLGDTSLVLSPIIFVSRVVNIGSWISQRAGKSIMPTLVLKTERGWQHIEEEALATTT